MPNTEQDYASAIKEHGRRPEGPPYESPGRSPGEVGKDKDVSSERALATPFQG